MHPAPACGVLSSLAASRIDGSGLLGGTGEARDDRAALARGLDVGALVLAAGAAALERGDLLAGKDRVVLRGVLVVLALAAPGLAVLLGVALDAGGLLDLLQARVPRLVLHRGSVRQESRLRGGHRV